MKSDEAEHSVAFSVFDDMGLTRVLQKPLEHRAS